MSFFRANHSHQFVLGSYQCVCVCVLRSHLRHQNWNRRCYYVEYNIYGRCDDQRFNFIQPPNTITCAHELINAYLVYRFGGSCQGIQLDQAANDTPNGIIWFERDVKIRPLTSACKITSIYRLSRADFVHMALPVLKQPFEFVSIFEYKFISNCLCSGYITMRISGFFAQRKWVEALSTHTAKKIPTNQITIISNVMAVVVDVVCISFAGCANNWLNVSWGEHVGCSYGMVGCPLGISFLYECSRRRMVYEFRFLLYLIHIVQMAWNKSENRCNRTKMSR